MLLQFEYLFWYHLNFINFGDNHLKKSCVKKKTILARQLQHLILNFVLICHLGALDMNNNSFFYHSVFL